MEKLVSNIISYLDYLKKACRLNISIHFDESALKTLPSEILSELMPYNFHSNVYCMAVKKKHHSKCICHQKNIIKRGINESVLLVCHAGVLEYITPFFSDDKIIGFVSVSGYRKKEIHTGCVNLGLWKSSLNAEEIPTGLCAAVIPPLCIMMERLYMRYANTFKDEHKYKDEYNMMLQFINEYHNNITLMDLCSYFGRSKSYISHMFKSKSGMTLKTYCNELKLEDARKMLEETDSSVTEIAFETGFGDVSYFIYNFRKKFGISPLKYRKNILSRQ